MREPGVDYYSVNLMQQVTDMNGVRKIVQAADSS
jgi:hypothetical protein